MSAKKAESRSRRLELLNQAMSGPLMINGLDGCDPEDPHLQRLLRDSHIKQIRVPRGQRGTTGFEMTPKGHLFRLQAMDPAERRADESARANRQVDRIIHEFTYRGRYRDLLAERETTRRNARRGGESQRELSRRSAATAALISAALREAEAEPFVLDTGWITADEVAQHFLFKVMQKGKNPEDGFTLYDRLPQARTVQIKKRLDGLYRDEFDLLVVRSLGGGAAICHILSDELVPQQAEHDAIYRQFLIDRENDKNIIEPHYARHNPMHRLILLSSGEAMNLYLQVALR